MVPLYARPCVTARDVSSAHSLEQLGPNTDERIGTASARDQCEVIVFLRDERRIALEALDLGRRSCGLVDQVIVDSLCHRRPHVRPAAAPPLRAVAPA
jgi:hypothetical protein